MILFYSMPRIIFVFNNRPAFQILASNILWIGEKLFSSPIMPKKDNMCTCHSCGIKESDLLTSLLICGVCRRATYCSLDCQKEHWPLHKAACTKRGTNDLVKAIHKNNLKTIKRLSKIRSVVNGFTDVPNNGDDLIISRRWPILSMCVHVGRKEILEILLNAGRADLEASPVEMSGFTPLVVAILHIDCKAIDLLLDAGADFKCGIGKSKDAFDVAHAMFGFINCGEPYFGFIGRDVSDPTGSVSVAKAKVQEAIAILEAHRARRGTI